MYTTLESVCAVVLPMTSRLIDSKCVWKTQGWELQKDAKSVTGTGQDWYYHWKAEELKRVNKSELVPTLIAVDPTTGEPDESKVGGGIYKEDTWSSHIFRRKSRGLAR